MSSKALCTLALIGLNVASAGLLAQGQEISLPKSGTAADLMLSSKTHVPGKDLKPDHYLLTVVADLADRVVLRITSVGGVSQAMFLAVPSSKEKLGSLLEGPITLPARAKGTAALRGFVFDDGSVAEFVYPKDEAVTLAQANDSTMLAVDPVSEGKPVVSKMSQDAQRLVTLWQLSPVSVGPEKVSGISAKRYEPIQTAQLAPQRDIQSNNQQSANVEVAAASVPPRPQAKSVALPISELPHTASSQPLIFLIALFCLGLAGAMSFRRLWE